MKNSSILISLLFLSLGYGSISKDAIRVFISSEGIKYFEDNLISVIQKNLKVNPGLVEREDYVTDVSLTDLYKSKTPGSDKLSEIKNRILTRLNNRFLRIVNRKPTKLSIDSLVFKAKWDKVKLKASKEFNENFSFNRDDFLFSFTAFVEASNLNFYMRGLKLTNQYLSLYDQNEFNVFTSLNSTPLKFKINIGFYKEDGQFKVEVLDPSVNIADILLNINYKHQTPLDLSIADIEVSLDNEKIWLYKNGSPDPSDDWDLRQAKLDSASMKEDIISYIPIKVDEYLIENYEKTVKTIKDTVQKVFDESGKSFIEKGINSFFAEGINGGGLLPAVGGDLSYNAHDCSYSGPVVDFNTGEYVLNSKGRKVITEHDTALRDPISGEISEQIEISINQFHSQTKEFNHFFSSYKDLYIKKNRDEYKNMFTSDEKLKLVCGFEWGINLTNLNTLPNAFLLSFDAFVGDTNSIVDFTENSYPFSSEGQEDLSSNEIAEHDVTLSFDIDVVNKTLEMSHKRKYFDKILIGETEEEGYFSLTKAPKVFVDSERKKLVADVSLAFPRNGVEMGGLKKFVFNTFLMKDWILLKMNVDIELELNSDGTYKIAIGKMDSKSIKADHEAYKFFGKVFQDSLSSTIVDEVISAGKEMEGTSLAEQVPIPSELGIINIEHKGVGIDSSGRILLYTDVVK